MTYEEHNERKRVARRIRTTTLRIGGEEGQPKGLWDRLVGLLKNPFSLRFERKVVEEIDLSERESRVMPSEQREQFTRDATKKTLAESAIEHERKALQAGEDPREPKVDPLETVNELTGELLAELEAMRDEGWWLRVREAGPLNRVINVQVKAPFELYPKLPNVEIKTEGETNPDASEGTEPA